MPMARKKTKIIFNVFPFVIVGIAILISAIFVSSFLQNSPYFKIKEIICSDKERLAKIEKIVVVKNKNIFSVNLNEVSKTIQERYPAISEISVTRGFPNKLIVTFKERIPFAKLNLLNKNFIIDNEAVIINKPENFDDSVLPTINGSAITFRDLRTGQKIKSKNLNLALFLLRYMNNSIKLKQFQVSYLDPSNLNKIYFTVNNSIQIMVKEEDFKEKLKILNSLFDQLAGEINNIKYIDLRFKDPIINYKKK